MIKSPPIAALIWFASIRWQVMVWHVKTIAGYYNEKKNPSDKTYAV